MKLALFLDLMDADVWKELSLKALLINTPQKNEAGYNFEPDSDGWDPGMGWRLHERLGGILSPHRRLGDYPCSVWSAR